MGSHLVFRRQAAVAQVGFTMEKIGLTGAPGMTGIIETCGPIPAFGCIHLIGIKI
jgi:hypothetical protein